jgi:hypothetical protein
MNARVYGRLLSSVKLSGLTGCSVTGACAATGRRGIAPYSSLIFASVAAASTSPTTIRIALFGAYQRR